MSRFTIRRAENFNGMLRILKDTQQALARTTQLLGRSLDTESVMERTEVQRLRDEIEQLGRDLASGLVDLEGSPLLDVFSHRGIFSGKTPDLEEDPRRVRTAFTRVSKRVA